MPLYYFHLCNSVGYVQDEEGQELDGIEAARLYARTAIRSLISEESKGGQVDLRGRIEVADGDGAVILTLPFSEAVEVRTGPPPSDESGPGVES